MDVALCFFLFVKPFPYFLKTLCAVCLKHNLLVFVKTILLKALWGGHTAALQFMLGMQLQVGERKHAMRDRRFARGRHHEACMRYILQVVFGRRSTCLKADDAKTKKMMKNWKTEGCVKH